MGRLQFSLRALLVLVLAVGCFFSGIATQRYLDRRRMAAKTVLPVDIVAGFHGRDLEEFVDDLGERLKRATDGAQKGD